MLLISNGPRRSAQALVYNFAVRSVIILFAKAPVPGRVKTRLQPPLTADEAAELHAAFVGDMLERLQTFTGSAVELHTDTSTDAWSEFSVTRRLQKEGDLGLKMVHSLQDALLSGYERALILGTDSPTVPLDAIRALLDGQADVALGPTDDGGYYAIAASRTDDLMFRGVTWSTPETLQESMHAIRACGLSVTLGRQWFDVDEPADLTRLQNEPNVPRRTAAVLHKLKVAG